jgi:hypothetical protein
LKYLLTGVYYIRNLLPSDGTIDYCTFAKTLTKQ